MQISKLIQKLRVSTLSPFPRYNFSSQIPQDYDLVFEKKHQYGQAGTLHTNLQYNKIKIHLKTIWEDYALLKLYSQSKDLGNKLSFREEENNCYLEDTEPSQDQKEAYLLAEIPEYYSLDIKNRDSVGFVKGDVSSKLFGNANLELTDPGNEFQASKIKSEYFDVKINKGAFKISSFLESAQFNLNCHEGNLDIKRLGLSGTGEFQVEKGTLNIGSLYCGYHFAQKGEDAEARSINISNDMKSIEEMINDLRERIKQTQHTKIVGQDINVNITHLQGNTIIESEAGNYNLPNLESELLVLKLTKGEIKLTLSKLRSEGIIYLKDGTLNLGIDPNTRINIYLSKEQRFIGKGFESGLPILVVHIENGKLNLEEAKKRDIFAELKQKYNKQ